MLEALFWLAGGIVIGVVFDESFRAIWKRVKARGEGVVDKVRER